MKNNNNHDSNIGRNHIPQQRAPVQRPVNNQNFNRGQIQNQNNNQIPPRNPAYNPNTIPNHIQHQRNVPRNQPINNYNHRQTPNYNKPVNKNDDRTVFAPETNVMMPQAQRFPNDPVDIRIVDKKTNYRVNAAGKPKKRILKRFITFILSLILIAAILISGVFVGIYALTSKMNYISDSSSSDDNFFQLLFTKEQKMNILLIGTDQENDSITRSDTMMLVTIDNENEKIKLTSFMRDLWVTIPGYGEGRLNGAYAKGGAELLIKTLEENFKVEIDNYLLIDFEMFVQLIDNLGGIEVEVTEKEADFINRTTSVNVDSGKTTLNGKESLVYCRIRKLDSDFMRTQRQRKVISAILEKIKEQNITTTIKAGIDILPLITTNISPTKLTAKAFALLPALKYDVEQLRVPVDKHFSEQKINGQQVLVPDIDKNIEGINNFIN